MAFMYERRAVPTRIRVFAQDGPFLFWAEELMFRHLVENRLGVPHGTSRKFHRVNLLVSPAEAYAATAEIDETRDVGLGRKYTTQEHVGGKHYIHQLKPAHKLGVDLFLTVLRSVISLSAPSPTSTLSGASPAPSAEILTDPRLLTPKFLDLAACR